MQKLNNFLQAQQYYGFYFFNNILNRSNASHGYWLCCLLPLALVVGYISTIGNHSQCPDLSTNYKTITIISIALCIQTISFFVYLNMQAKLYKWLIIFIPFISGTWIFKIFLNVSWSWSLLWVSLAAIFYQRCYIRIMRDLPLTFTYGEASVLLQGIILFVINCLLLLNGNICGQTTAILGDLTNLNRIMMVIIIFRSLYVIVIIKF